MRSTAPGRSQWLMKQQPGNGAARQPVLVLYERVAGLGSRLARAVNSRARQGYGVGSLKS